MQITYLEMSNYRNLDGVKLNFDRQINFLVGENELGKSNLLNLLDVLFNGYSFSEDDFSNKDIPIKVEFSLRLSDTEKGFFEDHFTSNSNNIITIHAQQDSSEQDEEIQYFWKEDESQSQSPINSYILRNINYVFYDSLKVPKDELTFYKGRGSGRFLNYLINEFAGDEIQSDVDQVMEGVIGGIESFFSLVRPLKRQGLGLYTNKENSTDFTSRALKLNGLDGFDLQKSGYGIQFSTLLIMTIFERLARIKQSKRFKPIKEKREFFTEVEYKVFSELYLQDKKTQDILAPFTHMVDGNYYIDAERLSQESIEEIGGTTVSHIKLRKRISMVLGLDEPEIHMHPYMQRSLIKYVNELIQNQDLDFLLLLKKYFDIDCIDGQILIVSHSPAIIFNDYKQVVRFYKDKTVKAVSGTELNLPHYVEKHLLMNFPYIKEAFFSKCVILVEGETETGAIPLWANKILGDLDEHGIIVISTGGIKSIPFVANLLTHFKIPNVSIIDKDNNNDTNSDYTSVPGLRATNHRDFEEELFESIRLNDRGVTALFDFLEQYGNRGLDDRSADNGRLSKIAQTYSINKSWDLNKPKYSFREAKELGNINLTKAMFLSWLTGDKTGKSIVLGRSLGLDINTQNIPAVYKQLFADALSKVK